jgi:hypothetical protein
MEELIEGFGYQQTIPSIRDISISPARDVWVRRGRLTDEPDVIDVLGADGRYLGTIPLGTPISRQVYGKM